MKHTAILTAITLAATITAACTRHDDSFQPDTPGTQDSTGFTTLPVIYPKDGNNIFVPSEGGIFSFEMIVENPVEGGAFSAETASSWIEIMNATENGTLSIGISANEWFTMREGGIIVSYMYADGEAAYSNLTVTQDGTALPKCDIEINATGIYGSYHGNDNGLHESMRYSFYMTDTGFSDEGTVLPGGTYICIYLFSDTPFNPDSPVLPEGLYILDGSGEYPDGSISENNCYYMVFNESLTVTDMSNFSEASCTIQNTEDGQRIDIIATLTDGRTMHCVFCGDYILSDYSSI